MRRCWARGVRIWSEVRGGARAVLCSCGEAACRALGGLSAGATCVGRAGPDRKSLRRRRRPGPLHRPRRGFPPDAGGGRGHFHRDLVGLDLEQIVARPHGVAGRLEPFGDLALGRRSRRAAASGRPSLGALHQLTETYCVSRNSISPSCAPSRPMPLCFMPPNGAAGSETSPRLRPIMPKSSRSETRRPRETSRV